jgi:hypothetical protein
MWNLLFFMKPIMDGVPKCDNAELVTWKSLMSSNQ